MSIKNMLKILGILLLILGLVLGCHYTINKILQNSNYNDGQNDVQEFLDNFEENTTDLYVDEELVEESQESQETTTTNAIGVLEISSINLKVPLYDMQSAKNTVNFGVEILDPSVYPDETGQLIIAGHSGTGKLALFNNLNKITSSDIIKIYYKDKIYEYVLGFKDQQEKDGELSIKHSSQYPLVLITCTPDSSETQDIYYFRLAS